MSNASSIPFLPDSAPFTAEQRAYLNGFLAGLFSRVPASAGAAIPPGPGKPLEPLTILFGSQTGTAEKLARRVAKEAGKRGFASTVHEMGSYPMAQLNQEKQMLIVASTYGDGEPPDNAKPFWDALASGPAALSGVRFSVCALGDSNYPKFCAFGKALDERMRQLGARGIQPVTECDVDYEEPFSRWLGGALSAFTGADVAAPGKTVAEETAPVFDKKNPFLALLIGNRRLNGKGSAKDTRHFEFDLENSGLSYEAGDALGVLPCNDVAQVTELLALLECSGDEAVTVAGGAKTSLREALTRHYDISKISPALLKCFADRTGDSLLQSLTAPNVNGELTRYLWGREVIDLFLAFPQVKNSPEEWLAFFKKLQPRLYSIASSPKAHAGQVHLCVGVVRYESLGRHRQGVCSSFLADRVPPGERVPVFVHSSPNFRPPSNPQSPMIMVGPGTGIAPFRGFLHERRACGAAGKNWLLFGDQKSSVDFLYREEMEAFVRDGLLSRLDTAFSRDQADKVYVQHRMLENAAPLYAWLQEGGSFYVCGDAQRMAKDVDAALHQVVSIAGGLSSDAAMDYVKRLKAEKRYLRDVY